MHRFKGKGLEKGALASAQWPGQERKDREYSVNPEAYASGPKKKGKPEGLPF